MQTADSSFGGHLREWRLRRRMSQLDLACEAGVSSRHVSFVETGRARPSRGMVLRLCEHLAVPLRERNALLLAAGYAPAFPCRPLDDEALAAARRAVDSVLAGHHPYPALAVDRHWTLVAANGMVQAMLAGISPDLLAPPVNVLRLSLHPDGLAPRIRNLPQWRHHLLTRLREQVEASADPVLAELHGELSAYPCGTRSPGDDGDGGPGRAGIVVPLRLQAGDAVLSLFSTTTVFGTPVDITLSELAIEAFYPADEETAAALRGIARGVGPWG